METLQPELVTNEIQTRDRSISHYLKFATLLDSKFRIPGTEVRFGIDALTGLVPGFGDLFGAMLSLYIVYGAAKLGIRTPTLLRMLFNIGGDFLIGIIPFIGDFFDIFRKANIENVRILREYDFSPRDVERSGQEIKLLAKRLVIFSGMFFLILGSAGIWGIFTLMNFVLSNEQ